MGHVFFLTLIFIATSGCSFSSSLTTEDCGYSASYTVPKDGGEAEVIISRVEAEVLDGKRECGFRYVQTKVVDPRVGGKEMREVFRERDYFYIAPPGFDGTTDPISIKAGDKNYISQFGSIKRIDERVYVPLK